MTSYISIYLRTHQMFNCYLCAKGVRNWGMKNALHYIGIEHIIEDQDKINLTYDFLFFLISFYLLYAVCDFQFFMFLLE